MPWLSHMDLTDEDMAILEAQHRADMEAYWAMGEEDAYDVQDDPGGYEHLHQEYDEGEW